MLLDGQDIWQDPKQISKVRFRVGLVMQYPEYQLFEETLPGIPACFSFSSYTVLTFLPVSCLRLRAYAMHPAVRRRTAFWQCAAFFIQSGSVQEG